MATQQHLFDQFDKCERVRVPAQPVRTSIAAAESIQDMAGTLRGMVYNKLVAAGWRGATRAELVDHRLSLQTVCGRCNELLALDLIYDSGTTRPGPSGRQQVVLRAKGVRKP